MRQTVKKTDTILALDPGLRDLGFAVLKGDRLLDKGVLALRAVPVDRRLSRVREWFETVIRAHGPATLVQEVIPKRPLDHLAGLPLLERLLGRLALRHELVHASYSARTVRQTVAGDGWAGKRETAEAVCSHFPELRVYLTQDRKWKEAFWQNMFDAVALALHHLSHSQPPSRSR